MSTPITRVRLRRKFDSVRLALLALLPIALFLLLGGALDAPGVARFDAAAGEALRGLRGPAADALARAFDAAGSTVGFAAATLLLAVLFALMGRGRDAILTVAATAGAWGVNTLAKNAYERARPAAETLFAADGYAFPSGNATIGIALFGFAAIVLVTAASSAAARAAILAVAAILTLLMGVTRIYAGVHYPTDIVGGYFIGFAWLAIVAAFRGGRRT
ncbi:phosphatase PAP2 family protein [Paenibacillus sp.]|uniref:phosphatase PAP2 family protein n=1 Tax=Paenibacillus sp. TaxID=58172 RepID=UPI002D3D825F|nr:phosphatase PAP2 family protein [Paenibacillus sp.]HZG57449.1 phosphatase PAP2 family protein [Paenibacillus sp.]